MGIRPDWDIYCLGHTTKQLASAYFGEASIKGTAPHATALADRMIDDEVSSPLIFFCGDQRRDELPDRLRNMDMVLQEIVVYRTMPVHRTIDKNYQGILFFSPSAVESFFHGNYVGSETVLFAIGQTTATTIRKYTDQTIIISDHPAKEQLVQKAITYFTSLS
jgi:uroporphyrinogen-III synthase